LDDDKLLAILAAQSRLIEELRDRLAPARATVPVSYVYQQYEIAQQHRAGWRSAKCMLGPVVALLGSRDVASLQVADWTAYRVSRAGLAPSSLNYTMRCLKAMVRWAKAEGLVASVPQLCEAKKQTAKRHRETAPTQCEVGRLLDEADRARDRVIVLCACDAGMRNTEIRKLERAWVDRTRMEIRLPDTITKGHKSRVVPMTSRLLAAIDAIPRDIRSPLVLVSPRSGGPYSQGHMTIMWRRLAELAQLEAAPGERRVRLHDGRHGAGTNMAEAGVPIEIIQRILGHASLDQTADYVQRRSGDLPKARALLEAVIKRDS
jgi:integrase